MFSMPLSYSSETGGHIECLAFDQGHDGLLDVLLLADRGLEALHLALADQGVDGLDLDAEQSFDGSLDFRLGRVLGDVENNLVVFRDQRGLLGDRGGPDHVVVAKISHLNRSSRASTAALVSTSLLRRRMS